jgi:hypothetical protein
MNNQNKFELKQERSVSCTDTNDSRILFMKKNKVRQPEIKESLNESEITPIRHHIQEAEKESFTTEEVGSF